MKVRLTGKGIAMLAAVAGAAVSIAAHAQQSQQTRGVLIDENGNRVRESVAPRAVHSESITETRSESTFHDGTNTIKAKVEDGVATVTLNGEVVLTRPMSEQWERYDVKGPDGSVLATIERWDDQLGIISGGEGGVARAYGGMSPLAAELRAYGVARGAEPPAKVMMGITMGVASPETAEQLGINREETTLVMSVRDGLPAAAAGLKAYDVIVSVDGQTPATQEVIRKLLREKNAGDELKFEVLRRGEKQDITIKLEAYDPARLGAEAWTFSMPRGAGGGAAGPSTSFFEWRNTLGERGEELQKEIAELSAQMAERSSRLGAAAGKEAQELGAELAHLGAEIAEMARELAEEMAEQGPMIRGEMLELQGQLGNEMRRMFIAPPTPRAPMAPVAPSVPGAAGGALGYSPREAELEAQNQAYKAQLEAMKAEREAQQKAFEARMAKMEEMMQKIIESKGGTP